jgi:hypothetical protein
MVSLNCWGVLQNCLDSLKSCEPQLSYEVIVIDNGSTDGLLTELPKHYPHVQLIKNDKNVGFTKATNQAISLSSGELILWLNTDTLLTHNAISQLCDFLDKRSSAGIVGPKVLNLDGTFQPQCKRGIPTPIASLCYMLRLHRVFKINKIVNQYLLSHLSEDETHKVDAVSGCCLLAKREVWTQIGPLDEKIFAYGEDIDWCVRAKKFGWEIWYYPLSIIYHLKGMGGAHVKPYHKVWGLHSGMWVFYSNHLKQKYSFLVTVLVKIGISLSFALACINIAVRKFVNSLFLRLR